MILFFKHAFYNATYKNDFGKRFCALVRNIVILVMLLAFGSRINAQTMYGTTGLLHAPTADMQKDKTFMIGGSMIDHSIYRDSYWNSHNEYNPFTYNYYLNITIFPWLEIAYTCTLVKGQYGSSYCRHKLGANLPIKIVPSIFACEHGKKAGGNRGHHRLY